MSATEQETRICQGCGRSFTISHAELDNIWKYGLSRPVFCSNDCAMHGWDPQAIWMGDLRRSRMEEKESS